VIVTITLNASLRVGYEAERVDWGAQNRVTRVLYRAGGGGLAVARVLRAFGHDVVAAGLAGGTAGELIRADLGRSGVDTRFTTISDRRSATATSSTSGCVSSPRGVADGGALSSSFRRGFGIQRLQLPRYARRHNPVMG